jgi:LacI family transcriptional regulator
VGDDRITTARQRLDGARQALTAHHIRLPHERILRASPTGRGAVELVQAALGRAPRPDAIFATNNQVTIASLLAVSRAGLRMPEDLLFVGFDDLPLAELYGSGLSLVEQPTYDLGRRAAELLIERLRGMDGPPREVLLTPRLTVRGSSVRSIAAPVA